MSVWTINACRIEFVLLFRYFSIQTYSYFSLACFLFSWIYYLLPEGRFMEKDLTKQVYITRSQGGGVQGPVCLLQKPCLWHQGEHAHEFLCASDIQCIEYLVSLTIAGQEKSPFGMCLHFLLRNWLCCDPLIRRFSQVSGIGITLDSLQIANSRNVSFSSPIIVI